MKIVVSGMSVAEALEKARGAGVSVVLRHTPEDRFHYNLRTAWPDGAKATMKIRRRTHTLRAWRKGGGIKKTREYAIFTFVSGRSWTHGVAFLEDEMVEEHENP